MDYKMVIVVREDLNLSCGKIAAQVAHAAVSCAFESRSSSTKTFNKWKREGAKKVVVKVADLDELLYVQKIAKSHKLTTCLITDAGLTEIIPGTVTCLGIGPAPNELIDPVTGKLSLLK
jgi:PTH2 family peptidyl-tRNA hydrolase